MPIRIDAGSDHPSSRQDGRIYQADQEWTPETGQGHIGGYRVWLSEMHPVDGTPDRILHENQQHGWEAYRFSNLRDGDYLVTLIFSEIGVPSYAVFDVAIEDQVVLDDFRIYDEVGGNYALVRRFSVRVTDGELNVTASPIAGEPRLAAIEVDARPPNDTEPAVPSGLTVIGDYNALLLDWVDNAEEDLDGYYVYRAKLPDGPLVRRTAEPIHVSRWRDVVTATHTAYRYCISVVDVYGNESGPSACQQGAALEKSDALLPLYELKVPPEKLVYLYQHALSDEEVEGTFTYEGQTFPVTVRYRGGVGRYFHKKSWKVNFTEVSPFPGQDQINLRGDYPDRSLMRTKLATELFEAVGVPVPRAEHVLLTLNGEFLGVYTYNEQVDEGFLARIGRDPSTSIYKAVGTERNDFSRVQPSEEAYRRAYEKKTNRGTGYSDIIAFIERINDLPDEVFAYELTRVFDVATYLDYYAIVVLTSNSDFIRHNVYFLHDLNADRWEFVPYDLDAGFREAERPIDMGAANSPLFDQELNSLLLTRVLNVPQFRAYYCHRLVEFMDTVFSDAAMDHLIDTIYVTIEQDGLRDWHKRHRENNERFVAAPDELKAYVSARKDFLWDQIGAYCPVDRPYLRINEMMVENRATLEDPDEPGEFPAWFEIYNAGLEPVDLAGMYLTDDLARPTKFEIGGGVAVPVGGFITFLADGEPGQGPLHTSFRLSEANQRMAIFNGDSLVDDAVLDPHAIGIPLAWGRHPDGVNSWRAFNVPTPGGSNVLVAPVISETRHIPPLPTASDTVTVVTTIVDDGVLLTATLRYDVVGQAAIEVPMANLRGGLYVAQIPPQPSGHRIEYRVLAGDNDGQTSTVTKTYIVDYRAATVFINEVVADNETGLEDPDEAGEFPDWIELYNPGPDAVDLGGRYLSDDPGDPTRFRIADDVTIPAGGFLVFYADDDPEQGAMHTNFRLSRRGERVGLFDADAGGNRPLDIYTFGSQEVDVADGRCPDGGDCGVHFAYPTPGMANEPCGPKPAILQVVCTPTMPTASDAVTVSAVVSHSGGTITPTLWYSADGAFTAVPMATIKGGDGGRIAAAIPAQADGSWIAYYVQVDSEGASSVASPLRAPVHVYRYLVGYTPPSVYVNEFMADNATTLEDPHEHGEFPDWVELYNASSEPVDLGGKYLTDDLAEPTKFRIAQGTTIPPRGYLLFYADNDPEQGPFHTNFRLSRRGESVGLFDADAVGNPPIDVYTFGRQVTDVSERRYVSGGDSWIAGHTPTPGWGELGDAPYLPLVLKSTIGRTWR